MCLFPRPHSNLPRCIAIYCNKHHDDALELQESLQYQEAGPLVETGKSRGGDRQKNPCALARENVLGRCAKNTLQALILTTNLTFTRTLTRDNSYTCDT